MLLGNQFCINLLEIVKKDFATVQVRLWTDSEVALHWLSSPRRLKQFVQNKVDAINRLFLFSFWSHTFSTENPADLVPRGCTAQSLTKSPLWLQGPSWILNAASWLQWPKSQHLSSTVATAITEQQITPLPPGISTIIDITRFPSNSRLLATSVYVYRFCFRTGIQRIPAASEHNIVEVQWIHTQQQEFYPYVLDYLSSSKVNKSHDPPIVRQLNLFLDGNGLIRVQGRFTIDSSLTLLPHRSRFTDLQVLDYHQRLQVRYDRCFTSTFLDSIRTLRCSSPFAQLLYLQKSYRQTLSFAYATRVTAISLRHFQSPVFQHLYDFTGYFLAKDYHNNHRKVYICLFTC